MSEETKEYLKRVDELELKLTGEDKETFQLVLFGYNECARILEETKQENQQLKENNQLMQVEMCRSWEKLGKLNSILEEIREYFNPDKWDEKILIIDTVYNEINRISDKDKIND